MLVNKAYTIAFPDDRNDQLGPHRHEDCDNQKQALTLLQKVLDNALEFLGHVFLGHIQDQTH